jgi:hypothetical protein
MRERRSSERLPMVAPVEVVTRERTDRATLRDRSAEGALVAGRYEVGERVMLRFSDEIQTGQVVRVSLDDDLHHVAGVRFDAR